MFQLALYIYTERLCKFALCVPISCVTSSGTASLAALLSPSRTLPRVVSMYIGPPRELEANCQILGGRGDWSPERVSTQDGCMHGYGEWIAVHGMHMPNHLAGGREVLMPFM